MTNPACSMTELLSIREQVKADKPLIHCITNHISINDCANVVLAVGAKPIMAEHPGETAEITAMAQALAVNLGNINDARMASMLLSGKTAREKGIPAIIDIVGVACSKMRLAFAERFIATCRPQVIKGNMSEMKALMGVASGAKGIDAGERDAVTTAHADEEIALLKKLAQKNGAVIVASGPVDIITDGTDTCLIENGCEMLAMLTGTGCMLNVLTAAFLAGSDGRAMTAAVLATAMMGICGELAENERGTGTFHVLLLDALYSLTEETLAERIRCSWR